MKRCGWWMVIGLLLGCFVPLRAQPGCGAAAGTTTRETYASAWLGQTMFYSVYKPPCYTPQDAPYPVVFLFHGSNDDDGQWGRLGMLAALDAGIVSGAYPPMILVMPFGNVIANRNRFDHLSWSNIFLTELLPDVEAKYRLTSNPRQRVIAGISRGGFWAYQIGLRHPDLFGAIAGHSGFFDANHAEPADNPLDLMLNAPGIEAMRFWLDRGKDDFAAPGLDLMDERMAQRGVTYTYMIYPEGQHYNTYWAQHVDTYLAFYAQAIQAAPLTHTPVPAAGGFGVFATNTPSANSNLSTASPMATTAVPTTAAASHALYVPAVAFPALQTSISQQRLLDVAQGTLDEQLVVLPDTLVAFPRLHPATRTVEPDALRNTLWRDRRWWTLLPFDALSMQYRVLWVDDVPLVDQLADYPFWSALRPANFDPARLTRITFSGVTALTRNTRAALDANGIAWAASGIQPYVTRSDFFHISNEVSFIPGCPQTSGVTLGGSSSMCSNPAHFDLLKLLDVDIIELTGNHNNDYGYQAYQDTLAWYQANGMQIVGGGATLAAARQPLILDHHGSRIGLVACNIPGPYYALVNEDPAALGGVRPGAANCDWAWLETALPELAAQVDTVIVTIQYNEYEDYQPTNQQRFDYRRLAEAGADVILGTAEHKPQTYEFYSTAASTTAFIHYGMGNLFFDQPFWGNMRFIMNTLYLYDGRLLTLEIFPGIIDDLARPRLMTPEERENFLFFLFVQQNGF